MTVNDATSITIGNPDAGILGNDLNFSGSDTPFPSPKFRERLAQHAAEKLAAQQIVDAEKEKHQSYMQSLADVTEQTYGKSDYQKSVDLACDRITIMEIIDRMVPHLIGKTERPTNTWKGKGNKFLCPVHTEKNPSCAAGAENGLWLCQACGAKGDKFTMAGILYNIDVKTGMNEICERIADDFYGLKKPEQAPPVVQAIPPTNPEQPAVQEAVGSLLNWRSVMALTSRPDTFLSRYCEATSVDTVPEEYNFFAGIVALGLAGGLNTYAPDFKAITANFGVCFVGRSGEGKSRSTFHLFNLLREAIPEGKNHVGVHLFDTAFSGQSLVRALSVWEDDPSSITKPVGKVQFPVRALFEYPELSTLIGGSGMQGSILKDKMHDILDHKKEIKYISEKAGTISAIDSFASLISTTQIDRIKDLLKKSDTSSGFANRIMFVFGTPKPQISLGAVTVDLSNAVEELRRINAVHTLQKNRKDWTEEAAQYLDKLWNERVYKIKAQDSNDILTRLDLHLKRLALAFAINELSDYIEVHHLKMAEMLINYLVSCYGRVIGEMFKTEQGGVEDWLLQKIANIEAKNYYERGITEAYGPTVRELDPYFKKRGYTREAVNKAISTLLQGNLIFEKKERRATRGPSALRYYVEADMPPAPVT